MTQNSYRLRTEKLVLGYDNTVIIQELDLAIPTGKITVLVGANGCGKSTLLRGMARLLKPRSGIVYLDGQDVNQLPTKEVARNLAMLPQNPLAPEGLTVQDLVSQGRYPYQTWWQQWSKEDEEKVEAALEITNMIELRSRNLDTLSGGQRQRAWIAMTLAQDTDIILLDEPTTFLDLAYQIEILDLLWQLHKSQGRTIVMVLHDLNQACRYGDNLVAIKAGKIYAQGKPDQVMTEEMVQEVFNLNCKIITDPIAETPLCIPISKVIC
ncbi:MAG: ABC transporter ATP-binding protein [Spirulinaceae cyanobacterium]